MLPAPRRAAAARRRPRLAGRRHRRQLGDVERHGFGRILGLHGGLGDDAGDRLADIAHRSLASEWRGGVFIGEPSRCGMFRPHFIGPKPAAAMSA
jgi:hypothetical protein